MLSTGMPVARLAMALALSRSSRAIMQLSTTAIARRVAPSSSTSARECNESWILLTTVSVRFPAVRIGRFVGVMSTAAAPARSAAARSSKLQNARSKQAVNVHIRAAFTIALSRRLVNQSNMPDKDKCDDRRLAPGLKDIQRIQDSFDAR